MQKRESKSVSASVLLSRNRTFPSLTAFFCSKVSRCALMLMMAIEKGSTLLRWV